jgi:hypothetical protein
MAATAAGASSTCAAGCGASKVLLPRRRHSGEHKAEVLRVCQERPSLRGLSRTFGISRKTITTLPQSPQLST